MAQVQFRRPVDQVLHGRLIVRHQGIGVCFDEVEEVRVLQERYLDGFGSATDPVPVRERREEREVVDDCKRRSECAEEVLLLEGIHAVLYAHAGIVLREYGGGHTHQPHPAMRRPSGIANQIEQSSATDCDHE